MFTGTQKPCLPCGMFRFVSFARRTSITDKGLIEERDKLLEEAKEMTLSLYRTCIRSVGVIRYGNEQDDMNFKKWEEKQAKPREEGGLSMLSMLPPVNRKDELRSRAEYYLQYARENFSRQSDCLSFDVLDKGHFQQYIYHLTKGDEYRRWLLRDMKFDDPYREVFDIKKINDFEKRAFDFCERLQSSAVDDSFRVKHISDNEEQQDDGFDFLLDDDDDDDDSDGGLPPWYRNPNSR